jgi:hypothetical protein
MNDGTFTQNWVFDNWSQGTLLVAIPDAVAGTAEGNVDDEIHSSAAPIPGVPSADGVASTSCDNRYFANHMGQVPPNFRMHSGLEKFGNETGLDDGGAIPEALPNGVDFYWDEFPTNDGNCWYDNTGPDGTRASLTGDPPLNPLADTSLPGFLPENCASSTGSPVYGPKALLLLECYAEWEGGTAGDGACDWYTMPAQPGTPKAKANKRAQDREMRELAKTPEAKRINAYYRELAGEIDLGPHG